MFRNLLAFLTLLLTACGVPGQKNMDQDVRNSVSYHQSSGQCQQVDLSQTHFTPASLRSLTQCLNSNNQLPEINALIQSSRDEELAPLSEWLNRALLTRSDRLFEIDFTLHTMDQQGFLQEDFDRLSILLANGRFITSALHLLNEGYFTSSHSIWDYVRNPLSALQLEPNEKLLLTFEAAGSTINADAVAQVLDFALTLTDARVFQSLQSHFRSTTPIPGTHNLRDITAPLVQMLTESRAPGHMALTSRALTLLADGPLWHTLDEILPENDPQWPRLIPQWSQLLTTMYREQGRFFQDAPALFRALNDTREHPIACMQNSARLIPLTPQQVFSELNHLSLKSFLSSLIVARPFCQFPQALLTGTATFMPIAASDASGTLENWIRIFNHDPGVSTFIIDAMSDGARLQHLAPLVSELTSRGAWNDALLLASLFKITDRPRLNQSLSWLVENRTDLNNSALGVLTDVASRMNVEDIDAFISSLQPFIDQNEKIAAPLVSSLRRAFYATNSHPFVDLVKELFSEGRRNKELFTAVFKIIGRNGLQFTRVIEEVSTMARHEDGRLRDISFSLLNVFRHFSEQGRHAVAVGTAPTFHPRARHNLMGTELPQLTPRRQRPGAYESCLAYDFNFSLADYNSASFTPQFTNFMECLAFTEQDVGIEQALRFLTNTSLAQGSLRGRSLFSWHVDLITAFASAGRAVTELTHRFITALRDHRLEALIEAMPFSTSLAEPLLALLHQSVTSPHQTPEPRSLETWVRTQNASVCIFQMGDSGESQDRQYRCETSPLEVALRQQLARWEPQSDPSTRIPQIIHDFLGNVEHDFKTLADKNRQQNQLQTSWRADALLDRISDLYQYLLNPRRPDEDPTGSNRHKTLEGLLSFLKSINPYFNAFHHHATSDSSADLAGSLAMADELARWMIEQANTLAVIPYHFLGETTPRVILVNNMDRLGLILENADVDMLGMEPGTMGLSLVPSAWSNEPLEDRPSFAQDESSITDIAGLVEAFELGIPAVTGCLSSPRKPEPQWTPQERLCVSRIRNLSGFALPPQSENNLRQPGLISLFYHYAPTGNTCSAPTDCFGMKVIRNLFSALHDKTPEAFRSLFGEDRSFLGARSNLKLMLTITRTGVFRQGGLALMGRSPQDRDVHNFFRGGALLAHNRSFSQVETLLKTLVDPSEQPSTWRFETPVTQRGLARRLTDLLFTLNHQGQSVGSLLFDLAASLSALHLTEEPTDLLAPLTKILTGSVHPQGGRVLLTENIDALGVLLASPYNARLVHTLYEDGAASDSSSQWATFRRRLGPILTNPRYPRADMNRLMGGIVDFFHHPPAHGTEGAALYRQVLMTVLQEIRTGHVEELTQILARNPEDVSALLESLARLSRDGQGRELLEMMGRLLQE